MSTGRSDALVLFGATGDLAARKLAPARMVCCGAPDYLARYGTPQHPEDLRAAG